MKRARLGKAGISVSRFGLGTANFVSPTPAPEARALLDAALDIGIDLIDTADSYGGDAGAGRGGAEEIIGDWLAAEPSRRQRVVLATKLYSNTGPGPNDQGLSARHIRRACEASLRRLRTDHVDLYQMHHVDRATPWEEVWQAMEVLVRDGKVLYVGSSNFAGWHIAQASAVAADRRLLGLVSEQSPYHLANRMVELEVAPACEALGVGLLAWSPLGGGLLAGSEHRGPEGRRGDQRVQREVVKHAERLRAYRAFCHELGEDEASVALAWVLGRPGVASVILGPRTVAQLEASRHAMAIELTVEHAARLDEIWPGPGGSAPEAYAW
jgi:aryl-alcohol dehydrogenase-like predicted oxidoreductase